jgi:hypothetical protein
MDVASSILHSNTDIGDIRDDIDDEYSDDEFHNDDPLEQSFRHHESIEMEIAEDLI